jgi:CheY-like chemotaxis protein
MGENGRDRAPPLAAEAANERGVILIVGVERSVRCVTQRMLERRGFLTLQACDCGEAVALFSGRGEEVIGVVLDLGMPGMDAEAIFSALRATRSDLPILFTGGYGEDTVSARLVGAAGTAFLAKPFGLDALGTKAGDLFGAGRRSSRAPRPGATPVIQEVPA